MRHSVAGCTPFGAQACTQPSPMGGISVSMPSAPQDEPDAAAPDEQPAERYGPLIVRRMRKEDGRALIRFEWAGPPDGT